MVVLRYTQKAQFVAPAKVECVAFSRDGDFLAAGAGNMVMIWNISRQEQIFNFVDNTSAALSIAWGPGNAVHYGFQSGYVVTTVVGDGRQLTPATTMGFQASQKPVSFIALHETGNHLAVGGDDEVSVWESSALSQPGALGWTFIVKLPLPPITDAPVKVTSIFWASREITAALVVSYQFHGVITWDIATSTRLSAISLHEISRGALSPDGSHFAVSNRQGKFDVYETAHSMVLRTFVDHEIKPSNQHDLPVLFIHGGGWLLGGGIGGVNLWHIDEDAHVASLATNDLRPIVLLAANDFIPPIASHQGTVAVITNSAPKVKRHFQIATVAEGPVIILWETEYPDPERPALVEDRASGFLGTWITATVVTVITLFLAIAIPVAVSVRHENGGYPGS